MISRTDRQQIELVKGATSIQITVDGWCHLDLTRDKKLYHDIALAIQDYLIRHDSTTVNSLRRSDIVRSRDIHSIEH